MLNVDVAGPEALGVTVEGFAEQVARVGKPLHEIATGELYPATELTVTVTLAVFPATTVVLPLETETPKSDPPPDKGINCGLSGAESFMVSDPVFDPSDVGTNVTLIVQIALGATGTPQVLVSAKPAVVEMPPNVRVAVPVFVTVITWGALAEPTTWDPKVRLVGERETDA